MCALKQSLAELKIFGPEGDPDAEAPPKQITQVSWDEVRRKEEEKKRRSEASRNPFVKAEYEFSDRNAVNSESQLFILLRSELICPCSQRRGRLWRG